MTWKNKNKDLDDFYNQSYKASQGNFLSGFRIFLGSILTFVYQNSNTVEFLRRFENRLPNNATTSYQEFDNFNEITNHKTELYKIIKNKIKITPEEYLSKKNYVISSTERNIKSMAEVIPNNNFLFIYLPTRITVNDQFNIENRFNYDNLNIKDLHIIEKDYRNTLIKKLSMLNNIQIINIGDKGQYDWFIDESHFSLKGHKEITNLLQPFFENFFKSQ